MEENLNIITALKTIFCKMITENIIVLKCREDNDQNIKNPRTTNKIKIDSNKSHKSPIPGDILGELIKFSIVKQYVKLTKLLSKYMEINLEKFLEVWKIIYIKMFTKKSIRQLLKQSRYISQEPDLLFIGKNRKY